MSSNPPLILVSLLPAVIFGTRHERTFFRPRRRRYRFAMTTRIDAWRMSHTGAVVQLVASDSAFTVTTAGATPSHTAAIERDRPNTDSCLPPVDRLAVGYQLSFQCIEVRVIYRPESCIRYRQAPSCCTGFDVGFVGCNLFARGVEQCRSYPRRLLRPIASVVLDRRRHFHGRLSRRDRGCRHCDAPRSDVKLGKDMETYMAVDSRSAVPAAVRYRAVVDRDQKRILIYTPSNSTRIRCPAHSSGISIAFS